MKKRLLPLIFAAVGVLAVAAGCGKTDGVYAELQELAEKDAASVTLTVSSELGGETLTGTYIAVTEGSAVTVTYSYEKRNLIEEDGEGGYVVPDASKSTVQGTMKVENGKVTERNGGEADISVEAITASGLNFSAKCFENVVTEEGRFSADVKDVKLFLGYELSCTDMKTEVAYTSENISRLKVTYTADGGAKVTLSYQFA